MSSFVKTVAGAEFDQVVIEGSRQTPVLVDFWAPWCGPCRMLTPVLEKLAEAYAGKFVLAKVNSDENPELSQRYGVRSIPSVMAFVDGERVNQFLGAQPESVVRQFIESVLPTPADLLRRSAQQKSAAGDIEGAVALLTEAATLAPNNEDVLAELLDALLDLQRIEDARAIAARLGPYRARTQRAAQALARLELAEDEDKATDKSSLESAVAADPEALDARLALAKLYARAHRYEEALEQLMEVLRRDRKLGQEAARKTMLALFDLLGKDHPLVTRYRRELAAALH